MNCFLYLGDFSIKNHYDCLIKRDSLVVTQEGVEVRAGRAIVAIGFWVF